MNNSDKNAATCSAADYPQPHHKTAVTISVEISNMANSITEALPTLAEKPVPQHPALMVVLR